MLVCERILAQALPKLSSLLCLLARSLLRFSTVGVSEPTFGVAVGVRGGFSLQPLRSRQYLFLVSVSRCERIRVGGQFLHVSVRTRWMDVTR